MVSVPLLSSRITFNLPVPTEISGSYRVYGRREGGKRLLRDLARDEAVWVVPEDTVDDDTGPLTPGNVVAGTLRRRSGDWWLHDPTIRATATLAYVDDLGAVPGPAAATYDRRQESGEVGVSVRRDGRGETAWELHVVPQFVDGEDRWDAIRCGRRSLEPWFEALLSVEAGARHLFVCNPVATEYLALCCVPPGSTAADHLRERLHRSQM